MLYLLLIVGAVFSAMPGAAAEARSSNVGGQWELPTASQIATRAATYHRTQLTNRALTYREERPDYAYATQQAISFIAPGAACFGIGAVVSAIATALMAVQLITRAESRRRREPRCAAAASSHAPAPVRGGLLQPQRIQQPLPPCCTTNRIGAHRTPPRRGR